MPKQHHANAPRTEHRSLERLDTLGDNWDQRGSIAPSKEAIRKAQSALPQLYQAVSAENYRWMTPHIAASEAGEITMEWWRRERKITIYISDADVEYILVSGLDTDAMESGRIRFGHDFRQIWSWLHN